MTSTHKAAEIESIARRILGIETLTERRVDRLDFHELSVGAIREALQAAFDAGAGTAAARLHKVRP